MNASRLFAGRDATGVTGAASVTLAALAVAVASLGARDGAQGVAALLWAAACLLLLVVVWARPALAAPALTAVVFTHVSEVLVRQYGIPSLLQALVVVALLAAWRLGGGRGIAAATSHGVTLAGIGYLLVLLLSTAWAVDAPVADARVLEVGKALVLGTVLAALTADPQARRTAVWAAVFAAALLATLGVVKTLLGGLPAGLEGLARVKVAHIYGSRFESRIGGSLGDPNFFAQTLLAVLPIAVFLAWASAGRRRFAAGVAAALVLGGIALTYSRGAVLALAAQAVLAIVLSRRRLLLGSLATFALIAGLVVAPAEFTDRLSTVQQLVPGEEVIDPDSSFEERRLYTRTAWEMFLDRPVLGVGAGNYTTLFPDYSDRVGTAQRSYEPPGLPHYPHSLYLEIAAESGVLGLTAFSLLLVTAAAGLGGARRRYRARHDGWNAGLTAAVAVGLTGYLVSSLFLHGDFIRYLWLLLGLAVGLDLGSGRRAPTAVDDG